jgi:hypothetical protein
MIDRTHKLPGVRQCQLLKLARSTTYDQPTPVSEAALALMPRIDALHWPTRLPELECCGTSCREMARRLGGGTSRP